MNKKKIREMIDVLDKAMEEESLSNEEYLVFVANLLIAFGNNGIKNDAELSQINPNDSVEVEYALNVYPNNPFLASILQGHAVIKWSEFFKG